MIRTHGSVGGRGFYAPPTRSLRTSSDSRTAEEAPKAPVTTAQENKDEYIPQDRLESSGVRFFNISEIAGDHAANEPLETGATFFDMDAIDADGIAIAQIAQIAQIA